jgi:hypothetical protein
METLGVTENPKGLDRVARPGFPHNDPPAEPTAWAARLLTGGENALYSLELIMMIIILPIVDGCRRRAMGGICEGERWVRLG